MQKRLFVVANRLPVMITEKDGEAQVLPASGGLVSAINSYLKKEGQSYGQVFWAGVPGCNPTIWHQASAALTESPYKYLPVFVQKNIYEDYYNGFSNSVLWPLFHYFPSYAEYHQEQYASYLKANQEFAAVLSEQLRPGDVVWIHDYHLLPLASLIREKNKDLTIGFFLHIPFPSYEILRLMPRAWQEDLLRGMLGADLIGFHTMDYATYFVQSVQMVLGLDQEQNIFKHDNRLIKTDVFPISIDYDLFHEAYDQKDVASLRTGLQSNHMGKQIIFSVDRLDYTKGVLCRLKAYEQFLLEHPQYHEKVVFILVVVPSRDSISKYAERKQTIDITISSINSSIGNFHWQPIIYQYNSLCFEELVSLYTCCDVALITPLRDGMNLVAKEFVASRRDGKGVLILSEMAGAARELTHALIINPNDTADIAHQIYCALSMPLEEQQERIAIMQDRIAQYNVQVWANDFLTELYRIKERQQEFQIKFVDDAIQKRLISDYLLAERRLLLLDYDGTLVPFAATPQRASPTTGLLQLMNELAAHPQNDVYIISGRNKAWLQECFSSLPVHLVAEHGALYRPKGGAWAPEIWSKTDWKGEAHRIMQAYVIRCANSFIEEKEYSVVWHYRNSNPDQARLRAQELTTDLNAFAYNRDLQVVLGNKIVEIRNVGIDKGQFIQKVLQQHPYDFILAAGDDRTDEDMFRVLMKYKNAYTIKVGPDASYAHYNLLNPSKVLSLLQQLNDHAKFSISNHE